MTSFIIEYPHFFTATILGWKPLLKPEKYKNILINSLRFLVIDQRIILNAFVIMSNHIRLIWQMKPAIRPYDVQRDLLKYTAQHFKYDLINNYPAILEHFRVNACDRQHQFWKRRPLSIELRTDKVYQENWIIYTGNP